MFDSVDNEPMDWPSKRGGGLTTKRISYLAARRRLIQFAKFAVVESLNSTKDFEQIVDEWLRMNERIANRVTDPLHPPANFKLKSSDLGQDDAG